jgi:hypothetical protein
MFHHTDQNNLKKRSKSATMRKLLLFSALLVAAFTFAVSPASASTHPLCQWVQVDDDNNLDTPPISVYGYWADVGGTQVLIVCDPKTDEPVRDQNGQGIAYINNGQYVETEIEVLDRYEEKQALDWDNPKEVKPVEVALLAPNIPTGLEYDLDYYRQTGQLRRKTQNLFRWPMDYSFARLVPGSDPDYWLFIAVVRNPNPFPVKAKLSATLNGWRQSWWTREAVSKETGVSLGPNETKCVLLSQGKKADYFYDEPGTFYNSSWCSGYSEAWYYASLSQITDPEYPKDILGGGYYEPYVRWDGTDPTVYPLIPMRLAFTFRCWSHDPYKRENYYWYYGGREWPEAFGYAEYDPEKDDWSVSVDFRGSMEKPWYMSDADWQKVVDRATSNATTTLKKLFRTWYPRVPFWCAWRRDQMRVNGDTGQVYGTQWPGERNFVVSFGHLEPVPPSSAPRPPGYPWASTKWGGWLYTTNAPGSSGAELPAPVLLVNSCSEQNYTTIWWGGEPEAHVGQGTYITRYSSDPRYYDPQGWMRDLPVLRARPLFVEKYSFVPVEGDWGVLKKDVVPGYVLWASTASRPALTYSTQPVEITASWKCWGMQTVQVNPNYSYGGSVEITRTWRWAPESGWTFVGQSPSSHGNVTVTLPPYGSGIRWTASVRFGQTVTGSNPADFPVSWANRWGSGVSLFAPAVSLPEPVRLAAGETKFVWSGERSGSVELSADWRRGETVDSFESRVLAQVLAEAQRRFFSGQGDVVFGSGVKFAMTPTFEDGKGGVVCGSQKHLVYRPWVYKSRWSDYGWDDDLECTTVGFPGRRSWWEPPSPVEWGLYSYFGRSSPTEGVVVKAGDELLGAALSAGERAKTIPLTSNQWETPLGSRYWRFYENGNLYPPDYPGR